MGSPDDEPGRVDNETQHLVTLTRGFYMSKYEVTDSLWYEVMGGTTTTSRLPKNYVSWDYAVEFCNALSIQEGLDTGLHHQWTERRCDLEPERERVPFADRGGVGVCMPGGHADGVCQRTDHEYRLRSSGSCFGPDRLVLRQFWRRPSRGWSEAGERLGIIRHARQCVGVGLGRLPE